ncbi:tetratricopeptide repeat protein [Nannocystis bainbridge]|uniref:Tetratricopeptide repeat protein n=1 Tax=Nannocystis bainbridge TaxID=2995303 RepID=A0ABT5DWG9_9BACT|nr:tetratricopeptide repeat protein [Nannocystis bainbridge]MDC0717982.1 tetratricopeptide repeat protein [Nannocystis bainbridge]
MRNLIKIASIGALAVALTACGKNKTSTNTPDGGGGGGGGGGGPSGPAPAEASKEAKNDFAAAVKTYNAAKSDGKISGDECERVAGAFQKVYKTHGVQMALAQFNSGVVYEECGQSDKAEGIYAQLISQAPKFDLAYNNLGVIYWKKGQESKALDMFKKGVEANKLSARAARNNVAGLLRNQYASNTDVNAFNEAEKSIQGVLALDSGNQAAYENLARIYYDRGHSKDKSYLVLANLVVTQGVRVLKTESRESADLYNIQGLLLLERQDQVNALKAFKEAVRVEANHVEANLNIGFISIRFRDYATAEKAFEIALKDSRQAKNTEAHLALGVAQRGLRKFKEAEASYNKALKLNASDPRPIYNLGVLYQDHISTQDTVDTAQNEKLINVAKGHYNKFIETVKSDKKWSQQVLLAKDRIATIDETIAFNRVSEEMMKKAKELEAIAKKQEEEERKRLLDLEKQAEAAEAAGSAPAPSAPPAGGAAAPK